MDLGYSDLRMITRILQIFFPLTLLIDTALLANISYSDSVMLNIPVIKCSDGQYMSTETKTCTQCTICKDNEYSITLCNTTSDTVCQCSTGTYRADDGTCKECTKCPVGWGASPACTPTSNTVCIPCPKGSYSNVDSYSKSCQSCTQCMDNEASMHKCTSQQDTVCFRYQPKSEEMNSAGQAVDCEGELCETKDNSYLYTAPLYCALLGAIIVGLLIYVVLRCRINKKRAANTATLCSKNLPQYQIVQQSSYTQPNSSSLVYLKGEGQAVTTATKYRDVPSSIRKNIQRSLSSDGSWLKLANYLGFMPSEISQIQQKAESSSKRHSPATILLSEWTKREYSTIGVISYALASIDRMDLVGLLLQLPIGAETV